MGEIRLNDISYTGGGGGSNVEANPSGQATNTLVKLGVDNTIYGIDTGTDVEANPTGTATETLTKLGVDGTVYGIDSGTDVEANPSGTPTDELSTIGIDGTVYEIIGFELPEHVTMDETKIRISGDPTGWTSSENYYDEAISWSVGGRVYTKDNAQPALIAGYQFDGSTLYHTVAVSTIAAGTHYRWENYVNDQDNEFEYKGRTWYYSGGEGSYYELPYVGINDIGHFSTMLDAAKYLIDQADLAGAHFVQMSDPETGTILVGGGEKEDLSDATFKVTNDGAVYATEFYKNGVPIGGGGGSSYSETTLWSGTQASTGEGVSISLSDNINNFDAIIIDCGRQSGSDYRHGYIWYPVSDLSTGSWYLQIINTNDNCTAYWGYTSNTSITWASAYSAYPVTLFSIKGVNFGGGYQLQPVIYSTEEREIGVWTDGKPLYAKTLYVASGQINSTTFLNMPSQNDIERIVSYKGSVYDIDDQRYYALPYERITDTEGIWVSCHVLPDHTLTPVLFTRQSTTYNLSNIFVAIQYTKTTDTPGSGTWTPQGVPAVHYSTEEQVVGTWVDGSTIYEKTFNVEYLTSSTKSIAHGINNLGHVVQIYGYVTNNTYNFPMPYVTTDAASCIGITVDATNINIISINRNDYYGHLTIRYTKTS